jgi:hypothetical protein
MTARLIAAGFLVHCLLAQSALLAAAPSLTRLEPRGGQRGTAVKLTLIGRDLGDTAEIETKIPGAVTSLAAPKDSMRRGRELPFLIEISPDAPVGVYPVRVKSRDGLSNILLFTVGEFPEVSEIEAQLMDPEPANDSADEAQPVETPVIVNGTLYGPDRDYYRIEASENERLVIEVEARRVGSAVDPLIQVLDAEGRRITWNDDAPGIGVDARVDVRFPEAGSYFIAIRDSKFSEQDQDYYRLKIGNFAYAEGLYPLGWQRGGETEVEFVGGNLSGPLRISPDLATEQLAAEFAMLRVPGAPGALPMPFALTEQPAALEANSDLNPLGPEIWMNGRIAQPGEIDTYVLKVKPDEYWSIELQAATLGASRLYGIVTARDPGGEQIASTQNLTGEEKLSNLDVSQDSGIDQFLSFQVGKDHNEIHIEVEDLLGRGGPGFGYRIIARRRSGDFTLTLRTHEVNVPANGTALVTVNAERRGYDGSIRLFVPELPDGLIAEGGNMPLYEIAGSTRQGSSALLTLTHEPGAELRDAALQIWGEAEIDGQLVRRRARGPSLEVNVQSANEIQRLRRGFSSANIAPWLGADLPVRIVPPLPAAVEVTSPRYMRIIPGLKYELNWEFQTDDEEISPPKNMGAAKTPNVRTFNRPRKEDKGKAKGTFDVGSQLGWGPGKYELVLAAQVNIDGSKETIYAPAITVDVIRAYEIEPEVISLQPGAKGHLVARLKREPGFASPVEIKPENLPLDVTCDPITADPDTHELRLPCTAAPNANPGEYEIDLASSSVVQTDEGREIPITQPAVKAKLQVLRKGGKLASR